GRMRIVSSLRTTFKMLIVILILSAVALAALIFKLPFSAWQRLNQGGHILSPRGDGFESAGVFNPAVVKKDGNYVMLYRAQDKDGTSRLGFATSVDGISFTRRPGPV